MVGQHHQLNRCESEQTPGDGEPERTGKLGMLQSVGLAKSWRKLSNGTVTTEERNYSKFHFVILSLT